MKLSELLVASLAIFAMVGCDSPAEEDSGAKYTLTVDKSTIEANGEDFATFTLTDENGVDFTADSKTASKVYFEDQNGKVLKSGTRTFSATKNGTWTFRAKYKGTRSANTVTITAQNRSTYEKYLHKVCLFQCTGIKCGYCPYLTEALDKVRTGVNKDNVIILATHGSVPAYDVYALPWGNNSDLGVTVCNMFNGGGFPYLVVDLAFGSDRRSDSDINNLLDQLTQTSSARCGVKITKAQIDAEGNGTIEASVKAQYAGNYDLAWAVLIDNLPSQGGVESVYNDVVLAVSDNFLGMSEESKVSLAAEEEVTKTFTFKVTPFSGTTFNPADCKVVVMAHNEEMVDNANICAVGSSVGYAYNK